MILFKIEIKKSVFEITGEMADVTIREMSKDCRLTVRWRSLAKLLGRVLPDEKVDEWGWNPTRKEWAATKRHAAEKNAAEERRKPRRIPVLRAGGGRRNSKRTECLRFKRKT